MKVTFVFYLLFFSCSCFASKNTVLEHAIAPGGKIIYSIIGSSVNDSSEDDDERDNGLKIESTDMSTGEHYIFLEASEDNKPERNLSHFSNLTLTPDSKTLYFESEAWVTSNAIHSIDIETKQERFITDGHLICVVGAGEYQGDLIVKQHRYFVQGGAYEYFYLYNSSGKEIGLVAGSDITDDNSEENVLPLCQSIG